MNVSTVLDVRYNLWRGDKENSGSIYYRKFSGKGVDFNMWKVKVLALVRHKQFDIYLKKTKDNSISPSPTVSPQLLKTLKMCLYGADFSGKSWHDTLNAHLDNKLDFKKSSLDGCQCIYKKENSEIKSMRIVSRHKD